MNKEKIIKITKEIIFNLLLLITIITAINCLTIPRNIYYKGLFNTDFNYLNNTFYIFITLTIITKTAYKIYSIIKNSKKENLPKE